MALSTYMFNNTMQGYHHRGLIQNHGLLGQQGSPTAPTDMQWIGTFEESHTQTIEYTQDALPFFVREGVPNSSFNPNPNFTAVESPPGFPLRRIILTEANVGAESPYGCPVDWRNADFLVKVVQDSVLNGPLKKHPLARLELFKAIAGDSTFMAHPVLAAFVDSVAHEPLGFLSQMADKLHPDLDSATRILMANNVRSVIGRAGLDSIITLWGQTLALALSSWQHPDSTIVLSRSDTTFLQAVARLCPYTAGPAVGLARMMLFAPTKEYFSLMHECEMPAFTPPAARHGMETEIESTNSVRLYPNPSNGRISIEFIGGSPDANCTLTISGTDGKSVYATKVQKPKQDFDLKLAPGLYLYEVRCDDGLIDKGKLVITTK